MKHFRVSIFVFSKKLVCRLTSVLRVCYGKAIAMAGDAR